MIKRRGDRGQPCLTPREIGIHSQRASPKKGETKTSLRELRTKRQNQGGNPVRLRIRLIHE